MSVYFVQAGPYIKIGYSADPIGRSTTVTTTGKRPLDLPRGSDARLIGWVPGDRMVETCWHARFVADHVRDEWFYVDPDVVKGLIWEHPCGVDMWRMSAMAVFAADRQPGISRDEIRANGIPVEAPPELTRVCLDGIFGGAA